MGQGCCSLEKCNTKNVPAPNDQDPIVREPRLSSKNAVNALKNFALNVTNTGDINDFYTIHKTVVGEGGFGTVQRAQAKQTQQWYAVKSLAKKKDHCSQGQLQEEVEIMRCLDHPNIVRLIESFEDKYRCFLVLELCEGGELVDRFVKAGDHFTEGIAAIITQQMLLAVNYLHRNLIAHRDLKPSNFLLDKEGKISKATIKLIDFGISRRFSPDTPMHTRCGTPEYLAPEVYSGSYSEKADLWSLGVIAYVLFSGRLPFADPKTVLLVASIKQGNYDMDKPPWLEVSQDGKDFISALLTTDGASRPSAKELLHHRWLEATAPDSPAQMTKLEVKRLKAFSQMHDFKKSAMAVIATQLRNKNIEGLQGMFTSMDGNKDGTLSMAEFRKGFEEAGVEIPEELVKMFGEADLDGSGSIDYTEFLAATMTKKSFQQEDVAWNAFKKFDKDGSGSIDAAELVNVLAEESVKQAMHMDNSAVQAILASADKNRDGVIDFQEFFAMLQDR